MTSREGCAALATACADRRSEERAPTRRRPATPLLIEAAGHTCLAWWHAPATVASSPASPLAVVLASSWGGEDIAAYDAQRALAIALADGGLGTLRFEWPDTGDSSAATGSTTVADALAAFDAAAAHAIALSGHERLAFVGLRLGALLAAHAAAARLDVDALVALMPVASGRAFVREQTVFDAGRVSPTPGALFDPAQLPVSLGGFALPVRHLESLSALRWPAAATTSVLEALLVHAPQAAVRTASDALARMGMHVREWTHADPSGPLVTSEIVRWLRERAADATVLRGVPAIEDFGVADPANARTNAALAKARLDAATAAVLALARADAPVWMRLREQGVALRERVVRIAADARCTARPDTVALQDLTPDESEPALVGVLSERDRAGDAAAREAIVLLSSDRERRVGPQRLWVPWARRRAALGDLVLRLDIAGVGDSAPRTQAAGDDASIAADIARAVAWLRREKGVAACTVVGIGAGATHAWRAALEGLAVERIVAVDPTRLRRPAPRSSRAARALRLLRPGEDALAVELARGAAHRVSLNLVLSQGEPRSARLLRESNVKIHHVEPAHPDFAGVADKSTLYACLDALLAPARLGLVAPPIDAPASVMALRPSLADDALRAIARSSRHAA